jgi:hypothetical protein
MSTNCPVCGYDLGFEPWERGASSDEICPSCGIQFGYDDVPEGGGLQGTREEIYAQWRSMWIERGMPWYSIGRPPPHAWNPRKQLELIGIDSPEAVEDGS